MSPRFDRLCVISDLHLGGHPDSAVFDSGSQLAALVDWAAGGALEADTGLVSTGDIIDFLAFPGATYFNPIDALDWLRSLEDQSAPTRVLFGALRRFTAVPRAQLILLAGNHDIELALPAVREALLAMVAGTAEAKAHVTRASTSWCTSRYGTEYRCPSTATW